jgi:hypothetical protein
MGMGVNNHYQLLPLRHIHTERSKTCTIGNYNQLAYYELGIPYALQTELLWMAQLPCTQSLFALLKHYPDIKLFSVVTCFSLIKPEYHYTTRNAQQANKVLASHECRPQRALHQTSLSATKNGLQQSPRQEPSYCDCVHHLTQLRAGE